MAHNPVFDRVQSVRSALAFDRKRYAPVQPASAGVCSRQRAVAIYAGRVAREVCRRGCRALGRGFSWSMVCLHHSYTRCFSRVNPVHGSSDETATRRRVTPPVAIFLCLILFTIVRFVLSLPQMYYARTQYAPRVHTDEASIRSKILLNHAPGLDVTKAKLRWQDFEPDDTSTLCKHTAETTAFITDARGATCSRESLLPSGCCPVAASTVTFSCTSCNVAAPHCCSEYERCVSCCMSPDHREILRHFLLHANPAHPVYGAPHHLSVFGFCAFRCRTSSASVQHQNSYRSTKKHCYGLHRPRKELSVVNSDGTANKSAAFDASLPIPTSPLEWDPFYAPPAA
ncbi:hypothetical protein SDRG_06703 [Saprolegnia diclina VS20]|uniref:SREBP regulating gene protein n=1 Tax=Saprolegnia diclina (strain VS20) TaxID=1156394 RepID=T0QMQ3_SAPDV|nr:hypothetical protein SDRG_06703 [Saprolegnia diclina VS20]EQC35961.1 hypothetical protein SDRG_06703 [Saprolegnia diclina VS20]|eukprot:XP_008610723.1 hypothetical protein SDRG_06703 [Saprolegnia diclina VS20]